MILFQTLPKHVSLVPQHTAFPQSLSAPPATPAPDIMEPLSKALEAKIATDLVVMSDTDGTITKYVSLIIHLCI
jgi:hypothetical protein